MGVSVSVHNYFGVPGIKLFDLVEADFFCLVPLPNSNITLLAAKERALVSKSPFKSAYVSLACLSSCLRREHSCSLALLRRNNGSSWQCCFLWIEK